MAMRFAEGGAMTNLTPLERITFVVVAATAIAVGLRSGIERA
jgi:hypothetical protein